MAKPALPRGEGERPKGITKAFGYLRVSGQGQVDGDGFPRQREAITNYAKANSIRIVEWFTEEGISGTAGIKNGIEQDWAQRPAYLAMLEAIALNGVRTVVVERMDRLARDFFVQEYILRHLKHLKPPVKLLSAVEGDVENVDSDPTRKLMRGILGQIADYERAMITLKLRAARQRARTNTGRCEGRKPFGDRPGEQEIADRMKSMRDSGMPYDAIAAELNGAGVPTRMGRSWFGSTVAKILRAG